jgi:hypothetical protein
MSTWEPSNTFISALQRVIDSEQDSLTFCELDSHADTTVAGANFIPYGDPVNTVTVHAFSPKYGTKTYSIYTAATVYTCPYTGQQSLLLFHNTIYLGDELKHSLICPNQMRDYGLQVYDCPHSTIVRVHTK